jgi:hypothetical protein
MFGDGSVIRVGAWLAVLYKVMMGESGIDVY